MDDLYKMVSQTRDATRRDVMRSIFLKYGILIDALSKMGSSVLFNELLQTDERTCLCEKNLQVLDIPLR